MHTHCSAGISAPKVSPQTDEPSVVRLPHRQSWFFYLNGIEDRTSYKKKVLNTSASSIWILLDTKRVNRIAHLLLVAIPPHVHLAVTSQGQKVSTPTSVNGGPGVKRSLRMLVNFCLQNDPSNLRQVTQ